MTMPNEAKLDSPVNPETTFGPEELLKLIHETEAGECFHLTGGEIGSLGETTIVTVSSYHAPMAELVDHRSQMRHYGIDAGFINKNGEPIYGEPIRYPSTQATLSFPDRKANHNEDRAAGNVYSFDPETPWFRLIRGTLSIFSEDISVRIVRIDGERGFSDYWFHKEDTRI